MGTAKCQGLGSESWRSIATYLVATPLHTGKEENDTADAQDTADPINALDNLRSLISRHNRSWRWVIEDDGKNETNERPETTEQAHVAEVARVVDELGVHDGRRKWQDCEHHHANPKTALACRGQFGGTSQCCQLTNTGSTTCNCHAA